MKRRETERMLHRRWVHSHEEDTEREMVFRPATFEFPPSRGRRSFELKPDGGLVEGGIGPTDRPVESEGTWELGEDDRLVLRPHHSPSPRVMQIASVDEDRLVIEK